MDLKCPLSSVVLTNPVQLALTGDTDARFLTVGRATDAAVQFGEHKNIRVLSGESLALQILHT